ncbi:MAG: VWA domain-containing protein [Deltaproteobacteria bacterium]|nr:VWA domain-containing protein [Deltaproteobacteria bacterium]
MTPPPPPPPSRRDLDERARRWRLILGGAEALRAGAACAPSPLDAWGDLLGGEDRAMDEVLTALYGVGQGAPLKKGADLSDSSPKVARWLGDLRRLFPHGVAEVMQRDALGRLNLHAVLAQPELAALVEPNVAIVAQLISLSSVVPEESKAAARALVRRVVDDLLRRFQEPLRASVTGSLCRQSRNPRPRHAEIDWHRTIRLNLRHYQRDLKALVPERRVGFGRKRSQLKDVLVCVDQSGSMATSLVYSAVFGAVLCSLPALRTRVVVFDTSVVDLTEQVEDPAELLFGVQLGGGTDIHLALTYCQQQVSRPADTLLVLVSDLYEGGDREGLLARAAQLIASGVRLICLLALSDEGTPSYDAGVARALAALGVPAFGCTPDLFPELMGAALRGDDLAAWAARREVRLAAPLGGGG